MEYVSRFCGGSVDDFAGDQGRVAHERRSRPAAPAEPTGKAVGVCGSARAIFRRPRGRTSPCRPGSSVNLNSSRRPVALPSILDVPRRAYSALDCPSRSCVSSISPRSVSQSPANAPACRWWLWGRAASRSSLRAGRSDLKRALERVARCIESYLPSPLTWPS